jgi:multicomponent Na+:H+ antiporter subunit E
VSPREFTRRAFALAIWTYAVWLLLTWSATAEQLTVGAGLSLAIGCALAGSGSVVAPWAALEPRRFGRIVLLLLGSLVRIVRANVCLARRIWSPKRPLRSGMVIVETQARTDGELAATGLITSLIVDNQIADLDRSAAQLQYHAVDVPSGNPERRREQVTGPTERQVLSIARSH